jgi:hypothetical protein
MGIEDEERERERTSFVGSECLPIDWERKRRKNK